MSDDYDRYDFAVERRCPSCGMTWESSNLDCAGCPCGSLAMPSESYDSADAARWNDDLDRREKGYYR